MLGQQKPATIHTDTHAHNIKYCVERLGCVLYDEHQTRTHNKTALTPFNSFFMMRFTSTAPTMASHFWSEWFPANDKKSRHRDFTAHHQKPHSRKNGNMNINKNKRTDKQTNKRKQPPPSAKTKCNGEMVMVYSFHALLHSKSPIYFACASDSYLLDFASLRFVSVRLYNICLTWHFYRENRNNDFSTCTHLVCGKIYTDRRLHQIQYIHLMLGDTINSQESIQHSQ